MDEVWEGGGVVNLKIQLYADINNGEVFDMQLDRLNPLRVECAAIRQDDFVYSIERPARHHDVINAMCERGMTPPIQGEEGFLLNDGSFIRRSPAKHIARAAGQLLERASTSRNLFSEDVW